MKGCGRAIEANASEDPLYTIEYIEATLFNERVLIYFLCFLAWHFGALEGLRR